MELRENNTEIKKKGRYLLVIDYAFEKTSKYLFRCQTNTSTIYYDSATSQAILKTVTNGHSSRHSMVNKDFSTLLIKFTSSTNKTMTVLQGHVIVVAN